MQNQGNADPLGHGLLQYRLGRSREVLGKLTREPLVFPLPGKAVKRWVVTGAGCSEAHARFAVDLLTRHAGLEAAYWPLSDFLERQPGPGTGLVVFSQGLSPNACLALRRVRSFARGLLISAVDPHNLPRRSLARSDTETVLADWVEAGGQVCSLPVEPEDRLWLRVVGPLAGYLAAIQWVASLAPEGWPDCPAVLLDRVFEMAPAQVGSLDLERFRDGCMILASAPLCGYAQNLALKWVDGMRTRLPQVVDYLAFPHGPYQSLLNHPLPVIILHGKSAAEQSLLHRARTMLGGNTPYTWVLQSRLPDPWRMVEYEVVLNYLVLRAAGAWAVDLRHHTGRGDEGALYFLDAPTG